MSLQSKLDLANLGQTTVTKPCFDCVICFFCSHKISHFSPSKQTLKLIFFDKIQLTNYSSGLTSQFIEHLVLAFVHLSSELCISVPSNLIGLKLSSGKLIQLCGKGQEQEILYYSTLWFQLIGTPQGIELNVSCSN